MAMNMRLFDYVFGAYLGKLILGHSSDLKTPTCLLLMVGVLPMPLWKHWKVLKIRILVCFGKNRHMPRDWMWTNQPVLDSGPNLGLCRTTLDIWEEQRSSPHMC